MRKRNIDVVVISDVHLGSIACRADELLAYLNSIKPSKLVLNGDFLDLGNFNNPYFPPTHLRVVKKIIGLMTLGTEVCYLTGDQDSVLRRFVPFSLGPIRILNTLDLDLDGKKAWFFHGDILDFPLPLTRGLFKTGRLGKGLIFRLTGIKNRMRALGGRRPSSLYKAQQNTGKKGAVRAARMEKAIAGMAITQGYDYVVCGHLHRPKKEIIETRLGSCTYLNAGDWTESLTALEYSFKRWKLYHYSEDKLPAFYVDEDLKEMDMNELIASIIDMRSASELQEMDEESPEE